MRIIIQRVNHAKLVSEGRLFSEIKKGLMVLVGIERTDTPAEAEYIVRKALHLKLFSEDGSNIRWTKSVMDANLELLVVSQFTLYATTNKGNKPDFHKSMKSETSIDMFNTVVNLFRQTYDETKIKTGNFGNHMKIDMECDGPVTIPIERTSTNNNSLGSS